MKVIKIYYLGEFYESTYAIRCKDVKDIDEAREIILSKRNKWQEEFTDEEYKQKFGRNKVEILKERKAFVRLIHRYVKTSYEYNEYDMRSEWQETNKGGRGAMECYVFETRNDDDIYWDFVFEKERIKECEDK